MVFSGREVRRLALAAIIAAAVAGHAHIAQAADVATALSAQQQTDARAAAQKLINDGVAFLLKAQQADGSFVPAQAPVGMHALALKAVVQTPSHGYADPATRKGFDKLLGAQVETGGIYKDTLANYNTAIAISALAAADAPELRPAIEKASSYLKGLQWTDAIAGPKGEKIDANSTWFGGFGYGGMSRGAGRPDLSNTQMAIDALHDSGLKPDDPAYKNALKFITRLQNSSETNDQPWSGDDGGFVYGPSDTGKGESFAGEYAGPDGRRMLRSYGSMTYAGLKSMIYAGLTKDDPRVKAAWAWIRNNWTLDENPGIKISNPVNADYGLYYYYHTLARTLRVYGEPVIVDAAGNKHDWRLEFIEKMRTLQKPDGSWAGNKKWMEDNPVLATSYVVLALQETVASLDAK